LSFENNFRNENEGDEGKTKLDLASGTQVFFNWILFPGFDEEFTILEK